MADLIDGIEDAEKGEEVNVTETDPGQYEGKQTQKHVPQEGSKRWEEIYHEAKDGQREIKDLKRQLKSRDEEVAGIKADFAETKTMLKEFQDELKSSPAPSKEENAAPDYATQITVLNGELQTAIKEEEIGDVVRIQGEIFNLKMAAMQPQVNVEEAINTAVNKVDAKNTKVTEDGLYATWRKDNPWYDENEDIKDLADAYGDKLVASKKYGYEQILDMVKKRMEKAFPEVTNPDSMDLEDIEDEGNDNQNRMASVEAGNSFSKRSASSSQRGAVKASKVKLTASELHSAKTYNVDPKEMLKEKIAILRSRGEVV